MLFFSASYTLPMDIFLHGLDMRRPTPIAGSRSCMCVVGIVSASYPEDLASPQAAGSTCVARVVFCSTLDVLCIKMTPVPGK